MTVEDYDAVYAIWRATPGIGLNDSDRREAIGAFLSRNPGLSVVMVTDGGRIVGTVLCGHDGRRGYLHHLAVLPEYRRRGLARQMIDHCLLQLERASIQKCNIFLFRQNEDGKAFWLRNGWTERDDLSVLQVVLG